MNKLIKDYFPDTENIDLIVQFADDIVESIKELESRRPTVESGKLKIDEAGNCLYYGDDAVIVNISTIVQCCGYGIGQAGQPILSTNFGSRQYDRVSLTLKYTIVTSLIVGLIWMGIAMIFPNVLIKIFMSPTDSVLAIAPKIIRVYSISFLILPFNVFSTYYFQALLKEKVAIAISLGRGIVLSGIILVLLAIVFGGDAMWWTMVVTESLVAIFAIILMIKTQKSLK